MAYPLVLTAQCPATCLGERCVLVLGHDDEHHSPSFYWDKLPPVRGRADQANPFARP